MGTHLAQAAAILEPRSHAEESGDVQGTQQRQLRKVYDAGLENYKNHTGMSEASIREELKFNLNRSVSRIKGLSVAQREELNQKKRRFEAKLDSSSKEALLNMEATSLNHIYNKLTLSDRASAMHIGDSMYDWETGIENASDPFERLLYVAILPLAILGDVLNVVFCAISFGSWC